MNLLDVLLFLLLCALALGWASRRFGLPYPIALVAGGGLLGFIPRLPQLDFDPQFLLVLVLPPILYQAALLTSWRDFKANLRTISLLAIGLVLATTLVVGAALKALIPEIPWAAALVFGAIVSPPDAVAATSILSRLNMPRRIVTVLEGESLVNDASGLVLYKLAVAAALSGTFSLSNASIEFVLISAGGIAIGVLLGGLFVLLHRYLDDPFIEVLLSLSVPYMAYVMAESVGASGVLAVVAAGLLRGRYSPAMVSAEMRILARSVWNILVFMLNSLIFILIGLQLSGFVARLQGYAGWDLATYALAISMIAILVRFAWVYFAEYLPAWLGRLFRRQVAPQIDEIERPQRMELAGLAEVELRRPLTEQLEPGPEAALGTERALRDRALHAQIARREPYDLGRLAVAVRLQHDGGCGDERHGYCVAATAAVVGHTPTVTVWTSR